jgi:hypothetical protein
MAQDPWSAEMQAMFDAKNRHMQKLASQMGMGQMASQNYNDYAPTREAAPSPIKPKPVAHLNPKLLLTRKG